jgi:broad specificity phosphatase PhoE
MLHFIRHGESTWNAFGDLSADVPLTDNGKKQASSINGFSHIVVCSELKRCRQTLENSNMKYEKVIYTDLCREIRGGTPCDYLEHEDSTYEENDYHIVDRLMRFKTFINTLREENPNKVITIISHHCFIHRLLGHRLHNCQIISVDSL